MRRTAICFLLLALASAAAAGDATPPQPPPLTGAKPPQPDSIPDDLVGDALLSYIGSAAPASADVFYFGSLVVLVHADMGPKPVMFTAALDLAAVGAYNDYAVQHGVPQGRIFFTDFVALAPMFIVSYLHDRDTGGGASAPSSGFYLRPLPVERGAQLGYRWVF
ncbi:MAG TPA: hypothetical protein VGM16_03545 [Gammaproteobacteria bacterium]|jgi:hypothetical protein